MYIIHKKTSTFYTWIFLLCHQSKKQALSYARGRSGLVTDRPRPVLLCHPLCHQFVSPRRKAGISTILKMAFFEMVTQKVTQNRKNQAIVSPIERKICNCMQKKEGTLCMAKKETKKETRHGVHNGPRSRDLMYVTNLDKLNPLVRATIKERTDPEEIKAKGKYDTTKLVAALEKKLPGNLFVAIVHDHDVKRDKLGKPLLDDTGKPIPREPHLHIGRRSKNAVSLAGFARALRDPNVQNVADFDKKYRGADGVWGNLVSYLFHRSKTAVQQKKYQYPLSWGAGNFDYPGLIKATADRVKKREAAALRRQNGDRKAAEEEKAEALLEQVRTGELQLADMAFHDELQVAYTHHKRDFETASDVWTQSVIKFAGLREQAVLDGDTDKVEAYTAKLKALHATPSTADVYYFCGPSGSGKTFLAKRVGSAYDDETFPRGVYLAAGQKHQFDNYAQQHAVVLDDVRSDTYDPATLLSMLDPNLSSKYLDARYKGSATTSLKYIALTNTNNLDTFVRYIKDTTENGDAESQYFRRFHKVVYVKEPRKIDDHSADVLVSYTIYEMKHEPGLSEHLSSASGYDSRLVSFNRSGDKKLAIFRKSPNGGYEVDHYSDYYLHYEKTLKILVPVSQLGDQEKPHFERKKAHDLLRADSKKAGQFIDKIKKDNAVFADQLPWE